MASSTDTSMVTSTRERASQRALLIVGFVVLSLFAFFPIYWMVLTSVTPTDKVFAFPPRLIPETITFEFYEDFFNSPDLLRYLMNSLFISTLTALLSLAIAIYAGYSFSKFRYTGRRGLMFLILSAQMFPQTLLLITLYLMFASMSLLNSYWALVLSFTTFTLPLCIWMLKGYFDTLPDEMLEAAKVDGASQFTIIHRILVPLARPALISTFLFAFIRGWNDFIFALTLGGQATMTLPPGLVLTYSGEFQTSWPNLMASSLIVSLPIIVMFVIMQRYIVAGLGSGAVKG